MNQTTQGIEAAEANAGWPLAPRTEELAAAALMEWPTPAAEELASLF